VARQIEGGRKLKEKLEAAGKALVPLLDGNLVDEVWGKERPAAPSAPLRVHRLEFAGKSVAEKLADLRAKMAGKQPRPLLLSWCLGRRTTSVCVVCY
jgi:Xaa-Pro aminopeptidase